MAENPFYRFELPDGRIVRIDKTHTRLPYYNAYVVSPHFGECPETLYKGFEKGKAMEAAETFVADTLEEFVCETD